MKIALLLSAVAGATAFAPVSQSRSANALAAVADLEGMLGTSLESGNKIWDPLEFSEMAPADWLRKSELSHGRSAMLATVGWVFPKWAGTFEGPVTTVDPVEAHLAADNQWWAQWIVFCGVIEGVKYRAELEGKSYSQEIDKPAAIDWTGTWSKLTDAQKEDISIKELKNGRLAMMAMAGFLSEYFIPGSVPGANI